MFLGASSLERKPEVISADLLRLRVPYAGLVIRACSPTNQYQAVLEPLDTVEKVGLEEEEQRGRNHSRTKLKST